MQKAEAIEAMKSDLKEAVSGLRMSEYQKSLVRARTPSELRALELQVRTDPRLRTDHRGQLLKTIERAARSSATRQEPAVPSSLESPR